MNHHRAHIFCLLGYLAQSRRTACCEYGSNHLPETNELCWHFPRAILPSVMSVIWEGFERRVQFLCGAVVLSVPLLAFLVLANCTWHPS
jgi:hypothetical protein